MPKLNRINCKLFTAGSSGKLATSRTVTKASEGCTSRWGACFDTTPGAVALSSPRRFVKSTRAGLISRDYRGLQVWLNQTGAVHVCVCVCVKTPGAAMNRSDYVFNPDEDFRMDPTFMGNKAKPRFSHTEVKVLLEAIKRNRYILLRATDHEEWADMKFDAKRRMTGPNRKNFRRKNLGPLERAVHKILIMSPKGDGESDVDLDEDPSFASISLPENCFSLCDNTSFSLPDSEATADRTGDDVNYESPDYSLDFEEEDDEDHSLLMESDEFFRSRPAQTYSRQESSPPSSLVPSSPLQNASPQRHRVGRVSRSSASSPLAQCVQQQRVGRVLLASVARSVETLARSLQVLKQRQQEFVQESLQLQRQSVDTLRDFSSTALAMLRTPPPNTQGSAFMYK
ncbi:hypothetical protein WMY93_028318 [Mugilogobius chulae]|uniref:Uncharacterized protein n=1 Tax=Mugilogobius chulae TaxID=88201 RepID=A0AAW0MYZ6_9GOBI